MKNDLGLFNLDEENLKKQKSSSDVPTEELVRAIYRAEGGDEAQYPYGIRSVKVADKAEAERVVRNTIRNNRKRFLKQDKYDDYIDFLGSRYAPIGVENDPKGLNKNWVPNVKSILKDEIEKTNVTKSKVMTDDLDLFKDYEEKPIGWLKERMDEGSLEHEKKTETFLGSLANQSKAIAYSTMYNFMAGTASMQSNLDNISKYIEKKTGLERGGLFEKSAQYYLENAEYFDKKLKEVGPTVIDEIIGGALGGALPGISQFMIDIYGMGALRGAAQASEAEQNELIGALQEQAQVTALKRVLGIASVLKPTLRIPAFGAVGAAHAPEGERAKAGGSMALYGMFTGGRGKYGTRELIRLQKTVPYKYTEGAGRIMDLYENATKAAKEARESMKEPLKNQFTHKWLDAQGNIKRELLKKPGGEKVVRRLNAVAGASPKAGNRVKAYEEKLSGLKNVDYEMMSRYLESKRTIEIAGYKPGVKRPEDAKIADHIEFLKQIDPNVMKRIKQPAEEYWKSLKKNPQILYDKGIITKKSRDALLEKGVFYSPKKYIQYIDPAKDYNIGGKKITVTSSGIEPLGKGSLKYLERDPLYLMTIAHSRTEARVARNMANSSAYNFAKDNPNNGIFKIERPIGKSETGELKWDKVPKDFTRVSFLRNGKQKNLLIPDNMAKEWLVRDPVALREWTEFVGLVSGSKILRAFATGYNPEFAITNLPRDIMHIWLTTNEYSSFLPKAALQMVKDANLVWKDAIMRKGRWTDYINEYGGMEFLTHQGRIKRSGYSKNMSDILYVMSYIGETSEIVTRLMLRERAIQNGESPGDATLIARDYMDFNQGGSYAKFVDSAFPYFNAGIVATRGIFRSAKKDPSTFSFKVAQIGALSVGLYFANQAINPEAWEEISSIEKSNNFILTTPWSYLDDDNNKRWLYFRIAKDQGQRAMSQTFEGLAAKAGGKEVDVEAIRASIKDTIFGTIPLAELPPSLDLMMGFMYNKDFWYNKDIWTGAEFKASDAYLEKTTRTSPALTAVTDKLRYLSPERAKYAIAQLLTSNNTYVTLAQGGMKYLYNELTDEEQSEWTKEVLLKQPFVRRVLKSTHPYNKFREVNKEAKMEANAEKYKVTLAMRMKYDKVKDLGSDVINKVMIEEIQQAPKEFRESLFKDFNTIKTLKDVPNKGWWIDLMRMSPEARAVCYWARWKTSNKEEQKELDKLLIKIPNMSSFRFFMRLHEIKKRDRKWEQK